MKKLLTICALIFTSSSFAMDISPLLTTEAISPAVISSDYISHEYNPISSLIKG